MGYRIWLDALRGIAVVLVVAHHFNLVPNGTLGVDVFFVLSGFLIASILYEEFDRTGAISLKKFYIRRALRLLPLLFTLVIGYVLFACCFLSGGDLYNALRESLTVATYTANLIGVHSIGLGQLSFSWSLCVEEHFYMVWPLVLIALLKLRASRPAILLTLTSAIAGIACWRAYLFHGFEKSVSPQAMDWFRIYTGTDTRSDALLMGCILGLVASWNWLPKSRIAVKAISVTGIASVISFTYCAIYISQFHPMFMNGLYTAIAAMVASVMAWMLVNPLKLLTQRNLAIVVFAGLGKISYGLYLVHIPVRSLVASLYNWNEHHPSSFGWSHPAITLSTVALSVVAAVLTYYAIERPFLNLKKRFETNRVSPTEPSLQASPPSPVVEMNRAA